VFKNNSKKYVYNRGVTLIELLIVMVIISIISATNLVGYRDSRSSIATQNLADDIALSIRKAQSYAIGVQGIKTSFEQGYGVHFSTNPDVSNLSLGSSKSFIIFADINKNGKYDIDSSGVCGSSTGVPTSTNECIEILSITSANKISSVTGVSW
jgi:prepilin-type N-terminal cleavage/methylation domain-containing protein